MSKPDGGPAFPRPDGLSCDFTQKRYDLVGMSLRDYFAAKAMHAIMQRYEANTTLPPSMAYAALARSSYEIAEAMLTERSK